MKVSIITVTYNSEKTIRDTLESVNIQTWKNIEHVIIDGKSSDKTIEIVKSFPHIKKIISEKDSGIYDAMNKGIKIATGDILGFLNSDDWLFSEDIIEQYVNDFENSNIDAVYGDLCFVKNDASKNIFRKWKSNDYIDGLFMKGWVPPHPTFYCKKEIFLDHGDFDSSLLFAADFDLMCRFFNVHSFRAKYSSGIKVNMRMGGATTKNLKNILLGNIEIYNSLKKNAHRPGINFFIWKFLNRISQILYRK